MIKPILASVALAGTFPLGTACAEPSTPNAVAVEAADQFLETLNPEQRANVLFAEWAGILNDEAAATKMKQVEANLDDTWFAWRGPATAEAGANITAYYRIQGPHLGIEYAPQSDEPDNHVHTLYRGPTDDDGRNSVKP